MTELTAAKVTAVMLAIRERRLLGVIGEQEPVSTERMAQISHEIGEPLSEITFRRAEGIAIRKARLALQALRSRSTSTQP